VSVVTSARGRNEASYIHSKVTSTPVATGNGASGKEEVRGFHILTCDSEVESAA